ncbi:MAG: hypothetical protein RHS_2528 [Robinsoniella sp. RHS]|nr:MAG: hypothetical protein RHS_2528 [Robinsoniella sp. RHS]
MYHLRAYKKTLLIAFVTSDTLNPAGKLFQIFPLFIFPSVRLPAFLLNRYTSMKLFKYDLILHFISSILNFIFLSSG